MNREINLPRLSCTYDGGRQSAQRQASGTRSTFGERAPFGNVRIRTEGPSEARIVAGGLLKLALWPVLFAVAAIFVAAFAAHGVADRGVYPTHPQQVAQER